jgi:hypothetical protein
LYSDIGVNSVKAKIAGELKERLDEGFFILYDEASGKLYYWTYATLRAIIKK